MVTTSGAFRGGGLALPPNNYLCFKLINSGIFPKNMNVLLTIQAGKYKMN